MPGDRPPLRLVKARAQVESNDHPTSDRRHHILVGLIWGTLLACAFTALLLGTVLLQFLAIWVSDGPPPEGVANLPVRPLILAFLLGGIACGTLLGVLRRSESGAWHGIAIGFLATLPLVTLVWVAVEGLGGLGMSTILGVVTRALALGLLVGLALWAAGRDVALRRR